MGASRRRTVAAALSFLIALVSAGLAQAQDYSGQWILVKSTPDVAATGVRAVALSMTLTGETLAFKRTLALEGGARVALEFTATTDGRPVTIKGRYADQLAVSCRREDDGRLVIERQQDGVRVAGEKKEVVITDATEIYSLSADGQTLTVKETSAMGGRTRTTEMVFRRKRDSPDEDEPDDRVRQRHIPFAHRGFACARHP